MEGQNVVKTVVAQDVEIVGSVKCDTDIRIDGKLNGDLTCGANAVIGNTASVKGNMSVESTTVMGQVNGNITAKDRIEFKSTARINGDIRAKRLAVEDGVTFVGKSEVNPSGSRSPAHEPPAAKQDAAAGGDDDADDGAAKDKQGGMFGKK